ncbi:MAG: [protein-PII] uridylyltransferase [Acidiferrobacterales bacterium]|nr:[protein-PII] uridylyltransferase [Acidiferrobacterales bacterium]
MSRISRSELFNPDLLIDPLQDMRGAIQSCQQSLNQARTVLAEHHLEGGNSAVLVRNNSWVVDQIILYAWRAFQRDTKVPVALDLIAAGGYGRNELNLHSDVDLLILSHHPLSRHRPDALGFVEHFIQFCWDIGLKVGHSTRDQKQCIEIAKSDISVITNLMETRLLDGDADHFATLQEKLRSSRVWPADKYFKFKLEEQVARHIHYGDTAYNLEPNIKESKGGLRDLHMISWVANRYFSTSDLGELVEHRFLTQTEYKALIRHRDFLWRLRNGLHLLAGRSEDRLLFDYQQDLAVQLGYKKGENHLAVEQMMKVYYRTAKEMQLLNELLLQHFREAFLNPSKTRVKKINERFQVVGNSIEATGKSVFRENPSAMLEIFLLMQKRPALAGVRAETIRQLRANLELIDTNYRNDPVNRKYFLEIFRHQTGLTHALRRMSSYGVLGAFFPAFGRVVGQMQHDLFHVFTVDAHSLFVVGNLRRLAMPEHRNEFPELTKLLSQQSNRERLYLAALCHDIGKGSGRDHSEVGEQIALEFCTELGLSEYDASFAAWLVRQHLIMSWTAQREDITDPRVIDRFAEIVGDQEHLDNLYLLTFADIRGTSPKVWSEWKGKLLSNLYMATSRRLRTGLSGAQAVTERIEARKQAIRKLVPRRVTESDLERLWTQLGDEYFLRNGPDSSAWHADVIASAGALDLPLVSARPRKDIGAHQILVLAPDRAELLPRITGGLDRLHLNIVDARIHSTLSGLSLLIFVAVDTDGFNHDRKWLQQTERQLKSLLLSVETDHTPSDRMLPRALKQFQVKTTISFNDAVSADYTVMEMVSQDRPGLLYQVAKALYECKVRLLSAKVSTVGERAEDTFFITDRDGQPVNLPEQRNCIEQRLQQYLD